MGVSSIACKHRHTHTHARAHTLTHTHTAVSPVGVKARLAVKRQASGLLLGKVVKQLKVHIRAVRAESLAASTPHTGQ